jgi:DNA-binding Lrp family transcriptional regulator
MAINHILKVSHKTGITTPRVKARFTRLVNAGFVKSVSPILDRPELDKQQSKGIKYSKVIENQDQRNIIGNEVSNNKVVAYLD